MNTLTYDFNNTHIRKGDQTLSAGLKPDFSFAFDSLNYTSIGVDNKYQSENAEHDLTDAQCAEIEAFIAAVEPDPTTQTNVDSWKHLSETDWYVVRYAETGVAIPEGVSTSRAAARAAII
jgi:hypothetical protein|tara:strand:- start:214 stop:573 length:360 start_codon:yes stop_codon:yes gene_type:complete